MTDQTYAYFDTSTWLKLYLREDGSKEARALARKYRPLSSSLLLLECFSALARKRETEDIESSQMSQLIKKLKADVTSIRLVNISDPVLDKAQKVALHTLARTLDAVHIASALVFQEMAGIGVLFITSDRKQYGFAQANDLKAIWVGPKERE